MHIFTLYPRIVVESEILLEPVNCTASPLKSGIQRYHTLILVSTRTDVCYVCCSSFCRLSMLRFRYMSRTNMLHLWETFPVVDRDLHAIPYVSACAKH